MNCKVLLTSCLCLLLATSANAQSFSRNVYIFTNAVSCQEGLQITKETWIRFKEVGISPRFKVYCVNGYNKLYLRDQKNIQLHDLNKSLKGDNHYMVAPYQDYFDGTASGQDSIYVAKPNRLHKSANGMAHEISHGFGVRHDFSNNNIMGYIGENKQSFNKAAVYKMKRMMRRGNLNKR